MLALQFPESLKLFRFALTGFLVAQATVSGAVISIFIFTNSAFAQEVKVNEQTVTQVLKIKKPNAKFTDLARPSAVACWINDLPQKCSYRIHTLPSNRISQFSSEQLKPSPNFEALMELGFLSKGH